MITVYRRCGKIQRIEVCEAGREAIRNECVRLKNKLVRAEMYMSNDKIPASEREGQVSNFKALTKEISTMMFILEKSGVKL